MPSGRRCRRPLVSSATCVYFSTWDAEGSRHRRTWARIRAAAEPRSAGLFQTAAAQFARRPVAVLEQPSPSVCGEECSRATQHRPVGNPRAKPHATTDGPTLPRTRRRGEGLPTILGASHGCGGVEAEKTPSPTALPLVRGNHLGSPGTLGDNPPAFCSALTQMRERCGIRPVSLTRADGSSNLTVEPLRPFAIPPAEGTALRFALR